MKKLYIGNISPRTSPETLTALFEQFGPVLSCELARDRTSKNSQIGLVELLSEQNSADAIRALSSSTVDGFQIQVSEARRILRRPASRRRIAYAGGMYGESQHLCR